MRSKAPVWKSGRSQEVRCTDERQAEGIHRVAGSRPGSKPDKQEGQAGRTVQEDDVETVAGRERVRDHELDLPEATGSEAVAAALGPCILVVVGIELWSFRRHLSASSQVEVWRSSVLHNLFATGTTRGKSIPIVMSCSRVLLAPGQRWAVWLVLVHCGRDEIIFLAVTAER